MGKRGQKPLLWFLWEGAGCRGNWGREIVALSVRSHRGGGLGSGIVGLHVKGPFLDKLSALSRN